ncbi:nitroreductase family protein [Woodsholea maritima]|uniref:nitroreductase family protein n=1 Tax=Woodsholea maritima TaxID=240237 RepID=UPI00039DB39F|nr:nitroreductase family protein [Woodsholea maritima]
MMTDGHVPLKFNELPPEEMLARAHQMYERMATRRTVRDFSDRPVAREIIEQAILTAGSAPSGANHQPWHFAAIQSPDIKLQIREAAEEEERAFYDGRAGAEWLDALKPLGTDDHKPFLETAPWLIAMFAQRRGGVHAGDTRKNYYINESCGIAAGFLIAALHEAGLATLTHTPKPMNFLNDICARPDEEKPFLLIVVGYPAPGAQVPEHALIKKSLEDISSWF